MRSSPFWRGRTRRFSHSVVAPLGLALVVGCSGAIGELGSSDKDGTQSPGGATGPNGTLATSALPLRGLTPFELQNTIRDLLGDPATELGALQPLVIKAGVETANSSDMAWSGGRADLLEQSLFAIASRVVKSGKLAACAAASADAVCFPAFVSGTLPLLFRRPVTKEELAVVVAVAESNTAKLGRLEAMARALELALMAADSLYLTTLGPLDKATGELSPYELAGRMSYVIWGSAPDKALLDAAQSGSLATQEGIETQARRLIADARSERGVARFFLGWTGVLNLRSRTKGAGPWTPELASDSVTETSKYIANWWSGQAPTFASLLQSDRSFLNQRLADFYGVTFPAPGPGGDGFQPVTMPAPSYRSGLLSQASFLATSTAGPGSSPTLRGRWVLENLFCLPQTPPDANTVSKAPAHEAGEQTRDYHEKLAAADGCKGCHVNMEATGVPFERFDGIGKLRLQEAGKDVRVNTTLTMGKDADGSYADERSYFAALGASSVVRSCVAGSLARYGLGRVPAEADAATVKTMGEKLGTNAREALLTLVVSRSFRVIAKP